MSTYKIIPAQAEHIAALDARMRDRDRAEVEAAGFSAVRILWKSYRQSVMAWTAFVDGEIAVMAGCGGSVMGPMGHPWMLTTKAVEKTPVALIKEARIRVRAMLMAFPVLQGHVIASYEQACRLLRLVGFTLDAPAPFGKQQELFCRYTMRRA